MICKNKVKSLQKTARKPKYKYKSSGGMGHEKKLKRKQGEALKNQTPEKISYHKPRINERTKISTSLLPDSNNMLDPKFQLIF